MFAFLCILQQDMLQEKLTKLKRLATDRRGNLDESKGLHMYDRESNDLEDWIEEQLQTAMSEEYGRDYEHLLVCDCAFMSIVLINL